MPMRNTHAMTTALTTEGLESVSTAKNIKNNMVIVTGDKLLQTFDKLEVAEFSAMSLIKSKVLGKFNPIGKKEIKDLKDKFLS